MARKDKDDVVIEEKVADLPEVLDSKPLPILVSIYDAAGKLHEERIVESDYEVDKLRDIVPGSTSEIDPEPVNGFWLVKIQRSI